MSEATFTPGEWVALPPEKMGRHWKIAARGTLGGDGSTAGASVLWNLAAIDNGAPGDTLETEAANARLFAASKELLAACEQLLATADPTYYPSIRAAVAKAKGTPR